MLTQYRTTALILKESTMCWNLASCPLYSCAAHKRLSHSSTGTWHMLMHDELECAMQNPLRQISSTVRQGDAGPDQSLHSALRVLFVLSLHDLVWGSGMR